VPSEVPVGSSPCSPASQPSRGSPSLDSRDIGVRRPRRWSPFRSRGRSRGSSDLLASATGSPHEHRRGRRRGDRRLDLEPRTSSTAFPRLTPSREAAPRAVARRRIPRQVR
jgi:hypothetical protein